MPVKGEFPLRENCDPTDPETAFLWMFAGMPGLSGGPLMMPIEYYRLMSKRLWDLGCRPVEEPTLEYIGPSASEPNWATSAGRWVEAGSVSQDDKNLRTMESAIARMGHHQKAEFYKALVAWEDGERLPATSAGQVVANMAADEPELLPLALKVLRDLRDSA